ncbi:MAG: hypothetical protein V3S33_01970 [Gammaproteobacteria bacterium]
MKIHSIRFVLTAILLSSAANVSASTIALHSGSTDPTTEGWTFLPGGGGGITTGAINDGGTPAWFVDDDSTALNTIGIYKYDVSAADITAGINNGWVLSTTLRVASDESLSFDGSPFVGYRDGITGWQMNFGLDGTGDTNIRLFTGGTTGPVHVIAGNSTYNTYSLRYDPVTANADLFVNGIEVISNYGGFANSVTQVLWGAGRSPDQGQGNFNLVSFSVVPIPAAVWLFGTGLLGLFGIAKRKAA